jgi:hypothetical protein
MYTYWESADVQRSWGRREQTATERIYRYEDLVADEHGAFRSMIEHFGWNVDPADLDAVVERLTFIKRSGGRERGQKDLYSHFRNGVPGDWKKYFDRDLARRFERASPGLLAHLGYETSDDWWQTCPERVEAMAVQTAPAAGDLDAMRDELARTRAALVSAEGMTEQLLNRIEGLSGIERELDGLMRRLAIEEAH